MPTCKTVRRLYCIEAGANHQISRAATSALSIVKDIRHHSPKPNDHQFLHDVLEALFEATGHDLSEHTDGCVPECVICAPFRNMYLPTGNP